MPDAEDWPKRGDGEFGEHSFFELSSKTRNMTVSGSFKVMTLASSSGPDTTVDRFFEGLHPAVPGVFSSSWFALYSSS